MSKRTLDKSATFFKGLIKCIFTSLVLFATSNGSAQGWDILFGGAGEDQAYSVIQTKDHGYITAGFSQSFPGSDPFFDFNVYVVRTDVDGTPIWSKSYSEGISANFHDYGYKILETEDEGFLVVGAITQNNFFNVYLLKIDKHGEVKWKKTYGNPNFDETGFDIVKAKDGAGYAIIGITSEVNAGNSSDILLIRINESGEELWSRTYGGDTRDEGTSIIALEDGFVFAAISKEADEIQNDIFLARINSIGDTLWTKRIGQTGIGEEVRDLLLTQDENLILAGASNSLANSMVAKYNLNGEEVWTTEIDGESLLNDVIETKGGYLTACGYRDITASKSGVLLVKLEPENGNLLWEKIIEGNIRTKFSEGLAPTTDGGYIVAGYNALSDFTAFNDVFLIKTDENGDLITNHIIGEVYFTDDGCNDYNEEEDVLLSNWIVKAESDQATYFATTDENGHYDIRVDSGFYTVSLLSLNDYWSICNNEFTIDFNTFYDTTSFNFPVEAELLCPYLSVNVSSGEAVICEDITYTVNYTNQGPIAVNDPYVEVQLDEELTFISSSIAGTDLGGNLFRFDIDDVLPTESDTFTIDATVTCDNIQEEQAIIVSAHVFPDTLCLQPGPEWDGASLQVTGICENDSIKFFIQNVGDQTLNPAIERNSFIVEDQIIFLQEPIDPLDPGEIQEFEPIKGNGSTFRIIAEQSVDHPGENYPTVAVEGCVTDGDSYTTGQTTQFPENDQDYYISIDVKEAISSNSPVILRGYPRGYQDSIITPTTDLNYTIVFQNLGTDTITRLVIRDTLPAFLDRTLIRPGASSHPYDFQIYDNGVLKFTFEEIQLLPDSSAEAALSRGFVKFAIPQKQDNPLGTIIQNSAAIYFDYEEPIYTNETRHFVGCVDFLDEEENCILVGLNPPTLPGLEIKVYPNPFDETVTIEIKGFEGKELTFSLFNVTGQLLRSQIFNGNKYDFNRNQLPSGLYIFKLDSEGKQIGSGKMLIR